MFMLVSVALYAKIRADLEMQIRRGELGVGDRLPTEAEIQSSYGVSRATAQRAFQELAAAGLVARYRKRGTFVTGDARQLNLFRMITPDPGGPEMPGRHVIREAGVVSAANAAVALPGVPPDSAVVQLDRLKLSPEGSAVALELSVIPFAVAPQLLSESLEDLAIHDYFATQGIKLARSRLYVEPEILNELDSDQLETTAGKPVLKFRRLSWLTSGELAEVTWVIPRPDQSEFYLEHVLNPSSTPPLD